MSNPLTHPPATTARSATPAQAADTTAYARALGYSGTRAVIVRDGRVISHRSRDWFVFCDLLRAASRRNQSFSVSV